MDYITIVEKLATRENVSPQVIEEEIAKAVEIADIHCAAQDLIEIIVLILLKTIYSKSYKI